MAIFNAALLAPPSTSGLIPGDAGKANICQATESIGWLDFLTVLKNSGVQFNDQTLPNILTQLTTLNTNLMTLNGNLETIKTAIENISLVVSPTDLTELIEAILSLAFNTHTIDLGDAKIRLTGKAITVSGV